jgi:tyrosine-protein phosphatase SIW14
MVLTERFRRIPTAVLVVSLALAPVSLATAQPQPAPAQARVAVDVSTIHIDNFGQINPNYYRGAQPKGSDYAALAKLGVKTLINLTSDDAAVDEEQMAKSAGLGYVQIPMTTREVPTAAKLDQFLKVVTDPASQPVFVHCVGGRHRTGVMTAFYRMMQDGWSPDQAFKEMKKYKFGADFLHPEFKQFVLGFAAPAHAAVTAVAGTTAPAHK